MDCIVESGARLNWGVGRQMLDGRTADARAPSSAWLDAHERHEAKKALDQAAKIPVSAGMMDWALRKFVEDKVGCV